MAVSRCQSLALALALALALPPSLLLSLSHLFVPPLVVFTLRGAPQALCPGAPIPNERKMPLYLALPIALA